MKSLYKTSCTLVLLTFFTLSCSKEKTKSVNNFGAYISGTISENCIDDIFLRNSTSFLDTLNISESGEFSKKFNVLLPGTYFLSIAQDNYPIFIDKNDSLNITLNLSEYENATVFKGKGSEKNNFYLELLQLINEDKNPCETLFNKKYTDFKTSADSLRDLRRAFYLRKRTEIGWDTTFDKVAQITLDYAYYSILERYAITHKQINIQDSIPQKYYEFRAKTEITKNEYVFIKPYTNYIISFIDNIAFNQKNNTISNHFKIADSLLQNGTLKNEITFQIAKKFILSTEKSDVVDKVKTSFLKVNTDNFYLDEIRNLIDHFLKNKSSIKLANYNYLNTNNTSFTNWEKDKNAIVFFWSKFYKNNYIQQLHKIDSILKQNSNYHIYAINLDGVTSWTDSIVKNKLPITYLKSITPYKMKRDLQVNYKKIMLIDDNTFIKNTNYQLK